jgi:hypothetical protein
MKKRTYQFEEETALSRLLGPTPGMRDEPPPLSSLMSIEDAYIDFQVRVYSRHKLIFEMREASIHECFLRRKEVPYAARKLDEYLSFIRDISVERFIKTVQTIFGWSLGRGRPRQKHVIIFMANSQTPKPALIPRPEQQAPTNREDIQI